MADVNPIHYDVFPESVEKLWNIWNIRLAVLFSLFLQIVLILLAPNRKHSFSKRLAFIIWSGYLLADATANYAAGLISSNQSSGLSDDNRDLITFWSPFLLVHLSGPPLALEDNDIWLHHFVTLVFQVVVTLYMFLQSLPKNKLMIPMILMFVSGCIKYLKRTRSLYLTSGGRVPDVVLPDDSNYDLMNGNLSGQFDDLQLVHTACRLFIDFKCQFVDLIVDLTARIQSCFLFRNITATTALRLIEVELNFMYDILFTKTTVVHSSMGFFFRFFSFCCLITSLTVFRFHITKHGVFNGINVAVTYALFLGAVALELMEFLMVVLSDWNLVAMIMSKESPNQNWWRKIVAQVSNFVEPAFRKIWSCWTSRWYPEQALLSRRWSGCLSGHNLIRYCLQHTGIPIVTLMYWVINWVGLRDLWDEMTCLSREPLRKNLWNLILQQLKEKSEIVRDFNTARQIASAKGEWVLQKCDLDEDACKKLKEYIDVPYDMSLVLWHVATELLYNDDRDPAHIFSLNNAGHRISVGTNRDVDPEGYVEMSKTLSDYMLYLLIMQPNIMPAVGGIGKARFQETCTAAERFFDRKNLGPSQQVEACNYILDVDDHTLLSVGENSTSVLFPARELAKVLRELESKKKWEFISQIWVELLCHAAVNSRGKAHAQQLSKGGELITFVWLLMSHFGIGYYK